MGKASWSLRGLQFLLDMAEARSPREREPGPTGIGVSHPPADGPDTWRPRSAESAPTAVAPFVPAEGRGVLRQTMGGAYDVATVGQFGFSLMRSNFNVQLSVNQMRSPGNVGGLFSLESVPRSTWVHLEDRQGRSIPVWVLMHGESVELLVGAGPDRAPVLRPTDRGA